MPPFEILRPLGKGAMGSVHEVRVAGDPRRLVAKILTSIKPNSLERFKREGEMVARLSGHPGIVSVHSHGILEGGSALRIYAKRRRLDPSQTAPLLARLNTFHERLTTDLVIKVEAGELDAVRQALLVLEKAIPKN